MKGILSGKSNHLKQDQAVNTTLAFAQEVSHQFNDVSIIIVNPKNKEQLEGEDDMDANDKDHITIKRDGAWVLDTWMIYIKPKYKESLQCWHKLTGGGDGSSVSYQKYCGSNGWLGWVYLKDEESCFLLASASDPNVPAYMRNEPGFEDGPSETPRTHRGGDRMSQSLWNLESAMAARNETVSNMNTAVTDLIGFLHKKEEEIQEPKDSLKRKVMVAPGSPSDHLWKWLEMLHDETGSK